MIVKQLKACQCSYFFRHRQFSRSRRTIQKKQFHSQSWLLSEGILAILSKVIGSDYIREHIFFQQDIRFFSLSPFAQHFKRRVPYLVSCDMPNAGVENERGLIHERKRNNGGTNLERGDNKEIVASWK
jgi:hypothetical protein